MRNSRTFISCLQTVVLILGLGCLFSTAYAQRSAKVKASDVPVADRFDQVRMVFMASGGPVIADLRLAVSGKPYRQWIGAFLARLLDGDNSGTLTKAELSLIPKRFRQLLGLTDSLVLSPSLIVGSAASDSDAVRLSEFQAWVRTRLPQAFNLIAQPQAGDDAVRLSSLLDTTNDGRVSPEELQKAAYILRFRDLDNDETLALTELLPYRDPTSQRADVTPEVANLPFFNITDEAASADAAERIILRYGTADGRVSAARLRLAAAASAAELPEYLGRTELQQLLLTVPVHLTLEFKLSDKANLSDLTVQISDFAASFCRLDSSERGLAVTVIDGLQLELRARGGGANDRMITRGLLGQEFSRADGDRSQSLDDSEYQQLAGAVLQAGVTAEFADLDADDDLQLTRTELLGYVEREQAAVASRIEVAVEQQGKTLFSRLDIDEDRRLTRRELLTGAKQFTQLDSDQDQHISEQDLQTRYVLSFGLGRSELRRQDGMNRLLSMMATNDAILPSAAALSGPVWFQRMDRNRDGDVSAREFLGAAEIFQRLDTDQDGLLSAVEAESTANQPRP
jgi:Ca2+-binding EF-hand superfamily protein